MERNLTTGSIWKNIFYFSLPYLLSYFLQTLYGMADLFIIGQFDGAAGTTAVSIGSQVMHMITVIIVGLAMGTTVSIAQAVGAKDKKAGITLHRKYHHFISRCFRRADGNPASSGKADRTCDVHTIRSRFRHRRLSDDLFHWYSIHHRV